MNLGFKLLFSAFIAAAVAACTQTSAGPPAASPAVAPAGCSGSIAQFRAVIDSDNATGNVNASVYKRMTAEVDRAAAACAGGRDAEAMNEIRATKARFGYP